MKNFKFKRFNDLKPEDINFDYHMHTSQTDAQNTAEEMIRQARIFSLESIAFTEHVNEKTDWYSDFQNNINNLRRLNENRNLDVVIGIEVKSIDFEGTLSAPYEIISAAEIIVGSVHRYANSDGRLIPLEDIKFMTSERAANTEFRLAKGLLRNVNVDILGHPFGVYSKFFDKFPLEYIGNLMEESLKTGVAFEINTKYNLGSNLFSLLRKINPYVSVGSDAHKTSEIARNFDLVREEVSK